MRDIKDLSYAEIKSWLTERGIAGFRAQQIMKWLYVRQADMFEAMTDLGKPVRETLAGHFKIGRLGVAAVETSQDGSRKFLFRLDDGHHIESVLIPEKSHYTLCISSQVGCAMRCDFCLTATAGWRRDLTSGEIVAQVRDVLNTISPDDPMRLTNIVFMGMGEPLANYDNLIRALEIITDGDVGLKFSTRRVTVSTAGLVPEIRRLGDDSPVNLAVSLNATDDETRSRLMPINRKYPLAELIAACRAYPLPPRRRITFEYILIAGINDSTENARRLSALLHGVRAKVNLIPFNVHSGAEYQRPSDAAVAAFQEVLLKRNHTAVIRHSKGQDISAACGQLRARHMV